MQQSELFKRSIIEKVKSLGPIFEQSCNDLVESCQSDAQDDCGAEPIEYA